MKQWTILLILPFLCACFQEDDYEVITPSECTPSSKTVSFTASFDDETRTSILDGGKVCWNEEDVITYLSGKGIYDSNKMSKKSFTITEDCSNASLSLELHDNDESLVAVYSSGYVNSISSDGAVLFIPEVQTGLFKDAHVSITKTTDLSDGAHLSFHNVTSLIKFTLERDDVGYVVFQGADYEEVCGCIYIVEYNPYNNQIAAAAFNEGEYRIRVNTNGSGDYYIETLPQVFQNGFKIECFDKDGYSLGCASTNKSLSLARSEIKNIGVIDSRLVKSYSSLSRNGTANCYLVYSPGDYMFNCLVQGNSKDPLNGTPVVAEVLWESVGVADAPSVGSVVNDVKIKDGFVCFTARKDGNAAIAVRDAGGSILWSWHIWVCKAYVPYYRDQYYSNDAGYMMDRNIGALSAKPGDPTSLGLLFQWGRKDPFMGACKISYSSYSNQAVAGSTLSWPVPVSSSTTTGTIPFAVSHPTTFITQNTSHFDWLYNQSELRWTDDSKSKYDPCPVGYRVPKGGPSGLWETAGYTSTWDSGTRTMSLYILENGGVAYYPACGFLTREQGLLNYAGENGLVWSATTHGDYAYYMDYVLGSTTVKTYGAYRADARPVRCCSE